jgi:hypothetical protein
MQENTFIIGAYFQFHLFATNHIGVLMYILRLGYCLYFFRRTARRIFTRVITTLFPEINASLIFFGIIEKSTKISKHECYDLLKKVRAKTKILVDSLSLLVYCQKSHIKR